MLKIEMENIVSKQGKLIYDTPEIYIIPKLQWIPTMNQENYTYSCGFKILNQRNLNSLKLMCNVFKT